MSTLSHHFKGTLFLALGLVVACTGAADARPRKVVRHHIVARAAPPEPAGPPVPTRNQRPALVVDVETGGVLYAVNPYTPWYPASLTKMMTVYTALQAMKAGRLSKDTPLTVSAYAANQPPSKMAFQPGSHVSLEAALYILFVKSANDVAVTVAEGVSGSVPAFVAEMNGWSQKLGMTGSVWRNPNGLHDPAQVTNAHDLAILARALIRDFPESQQFYRAEAVQYGQWTLRSVNLLIARYPGADGMKTGFICASGFNLVGSATRNGQRHLAVVLGENSARGRAEKAAQLLERSWNVPEPGIFSGGRVLIENLPRPPETLTYAPDMKQEICVARRGRTPSETEDADPPPVMALSNDPAANTAPQLPGLAAPTAPAALATAVGDRAPLLSPPPPQINAVVLGMSNVDPKGRTPVNVAVVGRTLVGEGLPLPAAATQPAQVQVTTSSAGTPVITAVAPAEPTPQLGAIQPNQPTSLVPANPLPPRTGAIPTTAVRPNGAPQAQTPGAAASLVTRGQQRQQTPAATPAAVQQPGTSTTADAPATSAPSPAQPSAQTAPAPRTAAATPPARPERTTPRRHQRTPRHHHPDTTRQNQQTQ